MSGNRENSPVAEPFSNAAENGTFDATQLAVSFNRFLDRAGKGELPAPPGATTDLYSLFVELAALKNEVKGESRWIKSTFEAFKQTVDHWEAAQQGLSQELERRRQSLTEHRRQVLKPVLLDWLEQRDRLVASIAQIETLQPQGWRALFSRRYRQTLAALAEGQRISLRRLDERLEAYDVYPIAVLNQPLNPHRMRALETACREDLADGVVVEELRRGFMWEDNLLRFADVRINKTGASD